MIKIFKFGGASVKNSDAIINLKEIVSSNKEGLSVIIVSAIDKTTNQLENVWKNYTVSNINNAIKKTNNCIDFHNEIINSLSLNEDEEFLKIFDSFSNELKEFLKNDFKDDNNLSYSKIVSYGELWSTSIISAYLNGQSLSNK